ncbi:MAG: glycosyltransferase family 2 protein [Candidatus Aenigmatarchaeota archaeon]
MNPKVSIIWLNYNSMKNIEVIESSLEGVCELDYPNFELIVVDNGSEDGSFEFIRDFLNTKKCAKHKIIRLEENLGFCGGNNVGYRAMDPESKYLVLLNNDCVPEKDSLNNLVEFMEQYPEIASSQGVILSLKDERKIDTAGDYISEFLATHAFLKGDKISSIPNKPYLISYADGCYSIYRVSAIKKLMGDKLFYDEFFAYFDDNFLGLKLWTHGFKVVAFPKIAGKHWRSMSFKLSPLQEYLGIRAHVASLMISNSPYNNLILRKLLFSSFFVRDSIKPNFKKYRIILKAIRDGVNLGKSLIERGEFLDINKVPKIKFDIKNAVNLIFRSILLKRSLAEEARLYGIKYIKNNIKSLYFD